MRRSPAGGPSSGNDRPGRIRALVWRAEASAREQRDHAGAAGYQAAVLFMVAGIIGLASDVLPVGVAQGRPIAILLDSINAMIGVIAVRLPWARWHPRATLVLPVLAVTNVAANNVAGVLPEATFGVWFILVFVWVGMWQPPKTSFALAPVAAAAYLIPFALGAPAHEGAAASVVISIPVAVLVGETIARRAEATRRAEAEKEVALAALAKANVTDDLTGLGNRRRANTLLDTLEDGDALAILDLDHFKRVNDTLGHHRGDEVLQQLGAFLQAAVREGDSVARYGGEEFVVVLRQPGAGAVEVIERILADWRALKPLATLSAGIARKEPGQSWSTTFSQADAALYDAKASGRDRAVMRRGALVTKVPGR